MLGLFLVIAYWFLVIGTVVLYGRRYGGGLTQLMVNVNRQLSRRILFRAMAVTTALLWLLAPVSFGWFWLGVAPLYLSVFYIVCFQLRPAWRRQNYSALLLWLWFAGVIAAGIPFGALVRNIAARFFPFG